MPFIDRLEDDKKSKQSTRTPYGLTRLYFIFIPLFKECFVKLL